MRRLSTVVGAAVLAAIALVGLAGGVAGADAPDTTAEVARADATTPSVEVVKLSGLIDPILADYLQKTVEEAQDDNVQALVLQINSTESVISDARLDTLAHTLADSEVPIIAWIGPSGARAEGAMAQLVGVVDEIAVAPGSAIGRTGELVVPEKLLTPTFRARLATLEDGVMDADAAAESGLSVPTRDGLVLRRVLLRVPDFRAKATATVPATPVQFTQLSTWANLMHTFASPSVAELFFAIGLSLLLFELFTAGVGIAGLSGAAFLFFGSYGLAVLPVHPVSVALIVASMVAFAVDVQVGVPRFWTALGMVLFTVGYVTLYDGLATPWPATIGGIVAVFLFTVFGMPAMTRSRFSTPVIARDWLVGRTGTAVGTLNPEGVIKIGEGLWAGHAAGAAIAAGTGVRVTAVEGVRCRVEADDAPGT